MILLCDPLPPPVNHKPDNLKDIVNPFKFPPHTIMHPSITLLTLGATLTTIRSTSASPLHTPIAPYGNPIVEGVSYSQMHSPFDIIVHNKRILVASLLGPNNVTFYFEPDANLCAYESGNTEAVYCSNTGGNDCAGSKGGCKLQWQKNSGNCCIYVGVPEIYGYCVYTQNFTAGADNELVLRGVEPYLAVYDKNGTLLSSGNFY